MAFPKIIWTPMTKDLPFERMQNCIECGSCHYVIWNDEKISQDDYLMKKKGVPKSIARSLYFFTMDEFHLKYSDSEKCCPPCLIGKLLGASDENAPYAIEQFKMADGVYDTDLMVQSVEKNLDCDDYSK